MHRTRTLKTELEPEPFGPNSELKFGLGACLLNITAGFRDAPIPSPTNSISKSRLGLGWTWTWLDLDLVGLGLGLGLGLGWTWSDLIGLGRT